MKKTRSTYKIKKKKSPPIIDGRGATMSFIAPIGTYELLALYSMYYGVSMSKYIRKVIEDRTKIEKSPNGVINSIAEQMADKWKKIFAMNSGSNGWNSEDNLNRRFEEFEKDMKVALKIRKINKKWMEIIMKEFKKRATSYD